MRITNNMMLTSTLRNINDAALRLNEANERVASEKKISLPSDDPVVATRAIKYRDYVAKIEQYQSNVDDVSSWQKVTDDALSDLNDVVTQLRTYVVQASSDTLSDSDLSDIKTEVEQLMQQALDDMNASYGGRYIFGGYSTGEAPYETVSTSIGDVVTFKGQYLSLGGLSSSLSDTDITDFGSTNAADIYTDTGDQSIKYNIGFDSEITVNTEGQDVVGTVGSNLFDTFSKVLSALDGDTSYKSYDVSSGTVTTTDISSISDLLTDIDGDLDRIQAAQADLGARENYVNSVSDRLDNDYTTYTTLMSNNEDADAAEVTIEASSAETIYEAALSVGAKAVTKTLIDYMA